MTRMRPKPVRSGITRSTTRPSIWLWLTAPVAVLVATAALAELLVEGLFRGDELNFVAEAIGQDYITLAVALPVLVVGAILARRGSGRARLLWLGALAYMLYTYVIYAFHVRFNPLFLVYVAVLGLSLYALIGGLATTDFEAIKARFGRSTPVRAVSIYLAVVTVLFYLVWLGEVVPALVSGGVPQGVANAGTPTGSAHVLDLAWMLPAMGLTALWLWREWAIAYTLAGALLTFAALIMVAIGAMLVSMSLYGQPVALAMAAVFGILAAVSGGLLVCYLRSMQEK